MGVQTKIQTEEVLSLIKREIAWAMHLLQRLPEKCGHGAIGSQLGNFAITASDEKGVIFSAKDIDRANRVMDVIISALSDDVFARRVVLGRALRVAWKDLQDVDPSRRCRRQLQTIHNQALVKVNFFLSGQK